MAKDKQTDKPFSVKEGIRFRAMDFLNQKAFLQLQGNTHATLEGSRGVLEYNEECIRIAVESMVVSFKGKGLALKCISPTSLTIEGSILAVEYCD